MEHNQPAPGQKRKLLVPGLIALGVFAFGIVVGHNAMSSVLHDAASSSQQAAVVQSLPRSPATEAASADTVLSNDNHYVNSKGNEVHSPAYAPAVPSGASAQCRDGTYSFSQSRSGTCSHHGGVATWL